MRLLVSVLEVLLALALVARGHFVASLHSNFVVNLDFEGDSRKTFGGSASEQQGAQEGAEEATAIAEEAEEGDVKVMAFAGGKRKFRCRLPSTRNRTRSRAQPTDVAKAKAHFISAKLANLRGTCWKLIKDYWTYDVCFGRKVVQYRPDGDMRFSLGEHLPEADELLPSGGVRELHVGGTGNRSSEIRYVCGSSETSTRKFGVEEDRPLFYVWTVTGPAFCAWRDKDGSEARDSEGRVLKVSALLEELRGSCINVTQGWWTYEYCYPWSLTQYHLQGNGKKRDTQHVLGTLNGTDAEVGVNQVDMTMVRLRPSIGPRERRAPPSGHRTLRQRLGNGTVCDETNRPRATSVHFQCPSNWPSKPETRIVSINEGSLCEYEMMVHTTLLCGHQKFLPTLPKGKETIQCVVEPRGA